MKAKLPPGWDEIAKMNAAPWAGKARLTPLRPVPEQTAPPEAVPETKPRDQRQFNLGWWSAWAAILVLWGASKLF